MVTVRWDQVVRVSKAAPTLQVVVNPLLRRGSTIHARVFQAVQELGCDYIRYVPRFPYHKLAVAELAPPRGGKTSWDFPLIDPMTEDYPGHTIILNSPTTSQWMFSTSQRPACRRTPPSG